MLKCNACKEWEWNFNLENHYRKEHNSVEMSKEDKDASNEITAEMARTKLENLKNKKKRAKKGSVPRKNTRNNQSKGKAQKRKSIFKTGGPPRKRQKKKLAPGPKKQNKKKPVASDLKSPIDETLIDSDDSDYLDDYAPLDLDDSSEDKPLLKQRPKRQLRKKRALPDSSDSSEEEKDTIFTRERKRKKSPPAPLPTRGNETLKKWEQVLNEGQDLQDALGFD